MYLKWSKSTLTEHLCRLVLTLVDKGLEGITYSETHGLIFPQWTVEERIGLFLEVEQIVDHALITRRILDKLEALALIKITAV